MNRFRLITRTLRHYLGTNLAAAAGIAVTTAVLCGALIVGDSLNRSLTSLVDHRLGAVTHSITAADRLFTDSLAQRLEKVTGYPTAAVLKTAATVSVPGLDGQVPNVSVWGVDQRFLSLTAPDTLQGDGVTISQSLADKLQLKEGDEVLVRLRPLGLLSASTPFVAVEQHVVTATVTVHRVVADNTLARFNVQHIQSAPDNLFVDKAWLSDCMDLVNAANLLLLSADNQLDDKVLQEHLRSAIRLEDLNLNVQHTAKTTVITTDRVFLETPIVEALRINLPTATPYLTYFVNSLSYKDRATPYSFVTATSDSRFKVGPGDVVINAWLAEDLGIGKGDSLEMAYYTFGLLKARTESTRRFLVKDVLPMTMAAGDTLLMPHLPGLSDAGHCREWKADIPIDLKNIRDKDEAYWNHYKGCPKAYIHLETGQAMWANPYGSLTTLLLENQGWSLNALTKLIEQDLDPMGSDFKVNAERRKGLDAAKGNVDFSQLFAGLGMFILFSGLLLTVLLFNLSLKRREAQLYLFAALGYSRRQISGIVLAEIAFIALLGGLGGMALSLGYTKLVFLGLESLWFDIVRTDALSMYVSPVTLLLGGLTGSLLGTATVYFSSKPTHRTSSVKASRQHGLATYVPLMAAVLVAGFLTITGKTDSLMGWFSVGILTLVGLIQCFHVFLTHKGRQSASTLTLSSLSLTNLKRNKTRSLTVYVLLSLGTFALVVTAANRKGAVGEHHQLTDGTGGFDYLVEATVPMTKDLNTVENRLAFGLPEGIRFVQGLSAYDDDASCLNLNTVTNPRLLAFSPEELRGRFRFAKVLPDVAVEPDWSLLDAGDGRVIPAVADMTVITWGLGKQVGDTLTYLDDRGDTLTVRLVAGLTNSIFQGNLLIGKKHFQQHFKEKGGATFLLVETEKPMPALAQELGFLFKEYGWSIRSTSEQLATFNAIENTYLAIFFLMGSFAMLLGTIGLAVVVAGSLMERKREMAVLLAVGFSRTTLVALFSREYLALLLAGLLTGAISGVLATLPTLLGGATTVGLPTILIVLAVLIVHGLGWIVGTSTILVRKTVFTNALHID